MCKIIMIPSKVVVDYTLQSKKKLTVAQKDEQ